MLQSRREQRLAFEVHGFLRIGWNQLAPFSVADDNPASSECGNWHPTCERERPGRIPNGVRHALGQINRTPSDGDLRRHVGGNRRIPNDG
jgi:hypothetical protein